jgi:hypothetical protein
MERSMMQQMLQRQFEWMEALAEDDASVEVRNLGVRETTDWYRIGAPGEVVFAVHAGMTALEGHGQFSELAVSKILGFAWEQFLDHKQGIFCLSRPYDYSRRYQHQSRLGMLGVLQDVSDVWDTGTGNAVAAEVHYWLDFAV